MMLRTLHLSNGGAVALHETGAAGSGAAPVLLIHGVGMCAKAWGPQMRALAGGNAHLGGGQAHHVIAADLPGHGASHALPGSPNLPDYVQWAARLIDALALGPVSVVGHSMGALIAAGLAIERPDLVQRAALLNSVHHRSPQARAAVLARAAEIAAGLGNIEAPLARWFGPDQGPMRDMVAQWLRSVSPSGYASAYRAFAQGDTYYAARFGEIRCPLLVLTGADDANSTPEMTLAMAQMAPLGQAVVIKGHRHMVNLTAPDAVNAALNHWLTLNEAKV